MHNKTKKADFGGYVLIHENTKEGKNWTRFLTRKKLHVSWLWIGKSLFFLWVFKKKSGSSFKNLLQGNFGATWEANAEKTSFKLYYYLKCSYLFELASDQGLKLENTALCTVKKRITVLGVCNKRRYRTGEIPWFLPLQLHGLHSSFHGRMGQLCAASSCHTASTHTRAWCSPKGSKFTTQMYSNSFQLVLYRGSTCIPHMAVTLLTWGFLRKSLSLGPENYHSL